MKEKTGPGGYFPGPYYLGRESTHSLSPPFFPAVSVFSAPFFFLFFLVQGGRFCGIDRWDNTV